MVGLWVWLLSYVVWWLDGVKLIFHILKKHLGSQIYNALNFFVQIMLFYSGYEKLMHVKPFFPDISLQLGSNYLVWIKLKNKK